MKSELPYCVQIVQALGPTFVSIVVGAIAAYVAYQQWNTAATKFKLDLFKERFGIFEVLDEINRAWPAAKGTEWVAEYFNRMQTAIARLHKFRLLYPVEIAQDVDALVELWHDFTTAKAEEDAIDRSSPEWIEHVRNLRRLWEKIGEHNRSLRDKIERFVRVDWKG